MWGRLFNLRRIGNPPGVREPCARRVKAPGRRINNPPQVNNLPHN